MTTSSHSPGTLSLVLPTLNEAQTLPVLLPELLGLRVVREILVVDDGSTDETEARVREATAVDRRVRWMPRAGPPSLAAALAEGIAAAQGELIGWMDADGTMRADDLARLVAAVEQGADLVVGSRFMVGGRIKGQTRRGLWGRLGAMAGLARTPDRGLTTTTSWLLNVMVLPLMLRTGVHDYTSGFLVGRRAPVQALSLRGSHGEYFIHVWMQALARGLRVVEVPYAARPRLAGQPKTITRPSDYLLRGRQYLGAALAARSLHDS